MALKLITTPPQKEIGEWHHFWLPLSKRLANHGYCAEMYFLGSSLLNMNLGILDQIGWKTSMKFWMYIDISLCLFFHSLTKYWVLKRQYFPRVWGIAVIRKTVFFLLIESLVVRLKVFRFLMADTYVGREGDGQGSPRLILRSRNIFKSVWHP